MHSAACLADSMAQGNGYGVSGLLGGSMGGQNGAPGSRHFDAPRPVGAPIPAYLLRLAHCLPRGWAVAFYSIASFGPKARGLHGLGRALFPRSSAGKQRQGRPAPFQRPKHQGAVALPPDEGQKRL